LDEFNLTKDDPMGDLEKIVKGEGDTGLPKQEAPQGVKTILEEELGVKLYGDETFDELMIIKNTGKHPRDLADGGRVAFRGGGMDASQDDFGGNTASDTGPGGGAQDTGPSFTGDSIGGSDPRDLGFIGSGPTISPTFKKGPTIISAPDSDPRFAGYTPSTFNPGGRNIFQKGFDLVKRTVTNPFLQNVGLGILGGPIGAKFGLTRQIDMFNKARAIKGLLNQLGPMGDVAMEEDLETIMGTDMTGQTTALYKDGGLVTLFTEKR
jgi:hypothetical protein